MNQGKGSATPFIIAAIVLVVGVIAVVAIAINATAKPQQSALSVVPSVSASATTQKSGQTVVGCGVLNGTLLGPLNPPANLHVYNSAPAMNIDTSKTYVATICTPKGNIVFSMPASQAPLTVNNFVTLTRNGFYDGLTFHRVVADFVIQGGDPKGDGTGGPGYSFADEPVKGSYAPGVVAMANSGPNTNGSQFFICIGHQCDSLPPQYNLFGRVTSGLDVAQKITQGDVMTKVVVEEQP